MKSVRTGILGLIPLGILLLSGCETSVDYQANVSSKLTIVSQITPNGWDESRYVYVYASQSPSDSSQFYTPEHLDVNVTTGDTIVHLLSTIQKGKKIFIFPGGFLKSGLTYSIEASAPGFQTVEASTTIPSPSTISDLTIKTISIEQSELNQFKKNIRYTLQFKINHTEPNHYYHLVFYNSYVGLQNPYLVNPELSDNQPFIHHYEYGVLLNRSDVRDDQTLIFNFVDWTVEGNDLKRVYVELRSITEEYYKYHSSLARQLMVRQDPFAEPVTIFNNIDGGYGNFSGFATSVTSSDLPH